jgi:hypothetical protein
VTAQLDLGRVIERMRMRFIPIVAWRTASMYPLNRSGVAKGGKYRFINVFSLLPQFVAFNFPLSSAAIRGPRMREGARHSSCSESLARPQRLRD